MFGTPRSVLLLLPWLVAPALLLATTTVGPERAVAQTAKNLNCNRCVDTRDIDRKAVTKSRIKKGAVNPRRLSNSLRKHVSERESFYVALNGTSTATIATNGPLTYFARCLPNNPDGGGGFEDRVQIVATSSVAGWFEEDASDSPGGNAPLNAGQEIVSDQFAVGIPGVQRFDNTAEGSMVAPDGSYLALEGDSSAKGLNLFGYDCIVVGNVYRTTGSP